MFSSLYTYILDILLFKRTYLYFFKCFNNLTTLEYNLICTWYLLVIRKSPSYFYKKVTNNISIIRTQSC